MTVFVRHEFNYDMSEASRLSGVDCSGDPGHTKQSFKEECDINTIVRNFGLSGEMPPMKALPAFGDYSNVDDFKSAMDVVAEARESFDAMPAAVRARFGNDPQAFLMFCEDASNLEEARKLGLVDALEKGKALAGVPGAKEVAEVQEAASKKP